MNVGLYKPLLVTDFICNHGIDGDAVTRQMAGRENKMLDKNCFRK